jgi:hypothetical protein
MTWTEFWAAIAPEYTHLAKDRSGEWWVYSGMPYIDEEAECWANSNDNRRACELKGFLTYGQLIECEALLRVYENWKESLVERSGLNLDKFFDL